MKTILILVCCIVAVNTNCQISQEFRFLNLSECTTGFFWGQTTIDSLPPDVTDYRFLSYSETQTFLDQLRVADITDTLFEVPLYSSIRTSLNILESQYASIPIIIAEIDYQQVTQTALDSGDVYVASDDSLHQLLNASSILETKSALIMHLDANNTNDLSFRFLNPLKHPLWTDKTLSRRYRIANLDSIA